jgi:hypothetical protein
MGIILSNDTVKKIEYLKKQYPKYSLTPKQIDFNISRIEQSCLFTVFDVLVLENMQYKKNLDQKAGIIVAEEFRRTQNQEIETSLRYVPLKHVSSRKEYILEFEFINVYELKFYSMISKALYSV